MLQYIKVAFPEIEAEKLTEIRYNSITESLINFEKMMAVKKYKFGLLYAKSGQRELEMYSNGNFLEKVGIKE
jgi:hypothetical protein